MVACFVFVFVVVPGASFVARMLAHGTASAWMVTSAVLAIGLSALYYLRYHYEARWKSSPGLSDSANGAADRFDLHPDVVRNDDDDEQSYISSLEARSGRGHGNHGFDESRRAAGRQPGIGFPADFLHMFMKSISIFGYIEEPVFHEFSRQLQTRRLLAGERMFESESDRDDQNFYVVIDGQVQIYLADAASRIPAPPPGSGSASDVGADDSASEGWSDAEGELDGALPMAPDAESSAPDLGSETAGGHPEPEEALLLNVVGPGDVLSSLLSILSLFAEGVPLRQRRQQQTGNSPPAAHTPRPAQRSGVYRALGGAPAAASQPVPPMRAHMSQLADMLAHGQENSSSKSGHGEPRPLRPNVVARATTDTTLAMIPATAFQRVTRLYPKAAAHILQVILTRLQRVTFATLYDYLDLPDELVAIERAICDLARLPLMPEIAQSDTLWRVRSLYAQADDVARGGASAIQSPTLGSRRKPSLSSRTSPSAGLASTHTVNLSSARQLPAAWKICRESLEALGARCALSPTGLPVGVAMEAAPVDADLSMGIGPAATQLPRSRFRRHRRRGSDSAPAGSLPSAADVEVLRRDALQQLCDSLGIDPNTLDGHPAPPSPGHPQARDRTPPLSMESAGSSARASRSSSVHRRSLPRTEYLLPLLQSVGLSEQKRASAAAPAAPLAQLASLTDEFGLYHVPDGQVLVEQGQRPPGLFVVLSGKVIITHRDSVSDFTGVGRDGERSFTTGPAKDPAAKTVSEVTRSMALLALKVKTNFERRERARTSRQRAPSASAQPATDSRGDRQPTGGLNGPPMPSAEVRRCRGGTSRRSRSYYARAGSIVGYLPALTDMASLYTASSVSGVVVGFISHWALERMAERYPVVLMTLARRLTSQLPAAILNIDYALEWVQVKASQMVYRQGESSDAVYVVLSGRLRAFVEKSNGGIGILAEFGQGQSVGEPNLLLNDPCGFSLHAIRDTELVRIPRALFTALMQSAPNLTFHLSQTLAVRTTQSLQRQHLMAERQSARQPVGAPHPEAGIRSHNKNLKSIALIPVDDHVPIRAFAEQLEAALSGIAGRVALLDHTAMSRVLGRHAFSRIARLKIVGWVAELEQRCRLLLHVADGGASSPWTRHCVHHSDFVLLVGLGDGDPRVGDYERLLLALKTTARKELVLLHETRTCGTGVTAEWLKRRPWVHAHHHIQMPLGYDDFDLDAEPSRRPASGLLDSARSLISRSILRPSQRVLPVLANSGLDRIRTSLEKYYRRLTLGNRPTPATYQGHRSDFARLARYLCGKSVGVVLSGGGARGIALLGVLQAFEETGIPVDMIGGTSIGAFISGLYAQTPDSVSIYGPLKAFSRRMSSMWRFLLDVTYPILAYTSGREFNRAIWTVFKDAEIEDLWLPFYCMTANITQSRSEVHTAGLLWRVVRASMSLGGFVPPLCDENGDLLVDGGYLDNLPVQVMKNELGASMIFAVDIAGENDTSPVRYGASVSGFWVLLNHLNPFRSYWIPTLAEVQSRLTYASSDRELENAKIVDDCVYLRVPPRDVGVLDFGRFDELYRRGYEYAKEWTAEWQKAGLLDQWQPLGGKPPRPRRASRGGTSSAAPPPTFKLTRRNSI